MSPSDARSQDPWTDPQTHLDTDPVNADPAPSEKSRPDESDESDKDES